MDRIALETLRQELPSDGKIVLDAFSKAGRRMALESEVGYEGCAHHARVAAEFPALIEGFIEQVKRQQGLDKTP